MNDDDIIQQFLAESSEGLDRLERELVHLEKNPRDTEMLASVFRTIHTIKGTCGFLGFSKLEKLAHAGENLLVALRDGQLILNSQITSALLATADAIRQMLTEIESTGEDGGTDYPELRQSLTRLQDPVESKILNRSATSPLSATDSTNKTSREPVPESIRVGVKILDNLMTLAGELVLTRNQLLQFSSSLKSAGLHAISQRLNLTTSDLHAEVMKTRMQPIGNIWNQFPRMVRDVALGCGKEASIQMEGTETKLDKAVLELIKDPLTHLVRNSVDHGIELPEDRCKAGKHPTGCVTLRAFHEGGEVNVEISDDGAGLNRGRIRQRALDMRLITREQAAGMSEREILNLIFLPSFSTAERVTSISGRGVGLDVVRTNVEKIGGVIDVESAEGAGTTVRLKIPLTLAIMPALIVTCGDERFAIPQVSLWEVLRLQAEGVRGIEMVHGVPVHRLRGRLLPIVYLHRELRLRAGQSQSDARSSPVNVLVLQADDRQFGLVVDQINDSEEILVKPLSRQVNTASVFAGCSIMGDGTVALILDVKGLTERAGVIGNSRVPMPAEKIYEAGGATEAAIKEKQSFLLFSGPRGARMAIPLSMLYRLEEFSASQIEMVGSQWATQYRGEILPLIRLQVLLKENKRRALQDLPAPSSGPVQVLVLKHKASSFGLVVDKILDIIEGDADVKTPASRAGVLYSAVISNEITEVLDVPAILSTASQQLRQSRLALNPGAMARN